MFSIYLNKFPWRSTSGEDGGLADSCVSRLWLHLLPTLRSYVDKFDSDDQSVAERARLGRSHGMTKCSCDKARGRATGYDVVQSGSDYQPIELTAALGQAQLRKLLEKVRIRGELAQGYREQIGQLRSERLHLAAT